MAVVTKGPVATAGSIFILAKTIGIREPIRAATDMELRTASPTDKANTSVVYRTCATTAIIIPYTMPRIKPMASSFKTTDLKSLKCKRPVASPLTTIVEDCVPIFPPIPIIIGPIEIEVNATDDYGIIAVDFYINGVLREIDYEEPYVWMWDDRAFGKQKVKIVVHFVGFTSASDEIPVWKFF